MQVASFFVPGRYADGEIDCLQAFGERQVEESHVFRSKQEEKRCISQPIAHVEYRGEFAGGTTGSWMELTRCHGAAGHEAPEHG